MMAPLINNISVDCVIFGFHNGTLHILLTKRVLLDQHTGETIFSDFTILGHHVQEGETVDEAASRVLKEKTGLDNIFLKQFYTFGDTDRLATAKDQLWIKTKFPTISDHVISVGYYSLVDSSRVMPTSDHGDTIWFPIDSLPELGYDHHRIIMLALDYLRIEICREPIGFELLPEKFTLTQLQLVFETIWDTKLDKRNFRKKVMQMKYVIALDEKQKGVAHKPAQIYHFCRETYERTRKEKLEFAF
jgi:8-oxo-dGTP diphosphatase